MINVVTPELALQCIQNNNLLQVDSIKLFGQGFDNFAFLVNKKYIFRFPKTEEADELLRDENIVLPHLENILPLLIPKIIFQGKPTSSFPFHFHGYEMLSGLSAYRVDLSDDELQTCLQALAHFLVKLHSIKSVQAAKMGVQRQLYDKTTVRRVVESLENRINIIQQKNIVPLDINFVKNQIQLSKSIKISHNNDCLVHGDLDFRHLLLIDRKLSGVIDWGDVGINHPVIDFVVVHQMFPKSMHDIFFKIYGKVDQEIWLYARFLALHRSITLILHGFDMQDLELLQAAQKSYVRLRDEF